MHLCYEKSYIVKQLKRGETKMKKKFTIIFALLLVISTLTACFGNGLPKNNTAETKPKESSSSSSNNEKSSEGGFKYGKATEYIAEHLKGDFSITYQCHAHSSSEGAKAIETGVTRTDEGYYVHFLEGAYLLIKNGDVYDPYYLSGDDGFIKVDFVDSLSEEEVLKEVWSSSNFMTQYDRENTSDMRYDGTEEIVGRLCDKYSIGTTVPGMGIAYKYVLLIDQETGVCMKYSYDLAASGNVIGLTFECSEFKTTGVTLPPHN